MSRVPARPLFIVPPELAAGYRLAGVSVRVAGNPEEARDALESLMEHERGVLAVYEPFLSGFDRRVRDELERSVAPVVIALPTGLALSEPHERRDRILGMLQRAVGYHVTFGGQEP